MRPDTAPATRPILALLARDARLHWGGLVLPAFLALVLSFLSLRAQETPLAFLGLSLFVALLVPHVLHLREESCGTLPEWRTLPASDGAFVAARFLQGVLSAAGVVLVTLLCALPRSSRMVDASWLTPGWLWLPFLFLALPMPISLRWGARGWITFLGGLFGLGFAVAFLVPYLANHPVPFLLTCGLEPALKAAGYLARHPWHHALLLLAGIGACFPLSVWALRARDL